jgi:hypothetical protein
LTAAVDVVDVQFLRSTVTRVGETVVTRTDRVCSLSRGFRKTIWCSPIRTLSSSGVSPTVLPSMVTWAQGIAFSSSVATGSATGTVVVRPAEMSTRLEAR